MHNLVKIVGLEIVAYEYFFNYGICIAKYFNTDQIHTIAIKGQMTAEISVQSKF